jgi:predicted short-subunit dehydrogenase-like oxidoreductase (DUF2520 family)
MKTMKWRAAIIGAGKVGTTLGRVLVEQGHAVECVISRTLASARAGGKFIGCRAVSTDLAAIPPNVNVILITTPHSAVADVARGLSRLDRSYKGVAVCHASGMLTAEVLEPLKEKGATVFSFHPLQTFPRSFPPKDILPNVRNIYYGVDGSAAGLKAAQALAQALQGHLFRVPPEMRAFYHAACVVASNHLTTLFGILDTMYRQIEPQGKNFLALFYPIIMATISNVRATSPEEALTGPIARGGVETVARHLDALAKYAPSAIPFYVALSQETVRLAAVRKSLTPSQSDAMLQLLKSYTTTEGQKQVPS